MTVMHYVFFCTSISSRMKNFLLLCLFLVFSLSCFSQNGRISGIIMDAKSGETLPGATALIEGTTKGAQADFDGKFVISNVPEGKVTLVISYIGYTNKKISGVIVKSGETTDINIPLEVSGSGDLAEVEVVVTLNKENNTALILQQKNNASVSDGISAETIRKSPDKNTSDVLKRVSGASIQDNKFAIVRGLNDRYNAAYLNGAPLPSTESDRKAFSFDLFPSNMLDNLVITKTARPDMPGEFAGGIIEINTKNIPEKNFIALSTGAGYNSITTGKEQLYYKGGKKDWLGIDDGTRALPTAIPEFTAFPVDIHEQAKLAKDIPAGDWGVYSKKFSPNISYQLSGGLNIKRKEKDFFGFIASLSYNSTNSFYGTERISFQSGEPNNPEDPLLLDKIYHDRTFQTQKLSGGLLNLSIKPNENHTISLKNLMSISSDDRTIERTGSTTPNESNPNMIKAYAFWFTQNVIRSSQLIGDHYFPTPKIKIGWNANIATVQRDVPNMRRHSYQRYEKLNIIYPDDPSEPPIINPLDTVYVASLGTPKSNSNDYEGVMMWSKLKERMLNYKADASRNFKINNVFSIEGKTGFYLQQRNRTFDFRQFIYAPYNLQGGTVAFSQSLAALPADQIFAQQNMGLIQPGVGGFLIGESTYPESPYSAKSQLNAGYAMADIKFKGQLRLIGGIRYEKYFQSISFNDGLFFINNKVNTVDTTVADLLPSANLVFSPGEKTNLRFGYSKTINRPEFRELAPFLFYDFNTGFSLNGDPYLKRALIHNFDFRYEWFPTGGQLISVSAFRKNFQNSIELVKGQNTFQVEYRNAVSAYAQGLEFEYRINVGSFIENDSSLFGTIMNNLTLFSNLSLIQSKVTEANFGNAGSKYDRPMQGQSPYLVNGGISYTDNKNNFSLSAMVNRIGPRIYIVGNNVFEEIWEYSRTVIDLQASKSFFKNRFEIRMNVKDLLAQPLHFKQNYDAAPVTRKSVNVSEFWTQSYGTVYSLQLSYRF